MISILLAMLRLLPFLVGSHRHLAFENLALRHQIAVYRRTVRRPKLRATDRLFWVGLPPGVDRLEALAGDRNADTVLRWQRRDYWAKLSARPSVGRPRVTAEIRALVTRMAAANPVWGAPRIHGELLKLGIEVAERTVSRLMPKRRPPSSQTGRTFLANHITDLVSIDFFTARHGETARVHGMRGRERLGARREAGLDHAVRCAARRRVADKEFLLTDHTGRNQQPSPGGSGRAARPARKSDQLAPR